jgi:hypothetical protein
LRIVNHTIKEIKKTNEFKEEFLKFQSQKKFSVKLYNYFEQENISVKEELISSIDMYNKNRFQSAKQGFEGIESKFIQRNSIEYALLLKYLSKTNNELGIINKAVSYSNKSVEILQGLLSEFSPLLIETKLENFNYKSYFTSNFENAKLSLLKCLVNAMLVNDRKSIVLCYASLGKTYKTYGQFKMFQYYSNKSLRLYKKFKLNDSFLLKEIILSCFQGLPSYHTYSNFYTKRLLKQLTTLLKGIEDSNALAIAHYQIAMNRLSLLQYSKVLEHLDISLEHSQKSEENSKMLAYTSILRWQALTRMGRIAFSSQNLYYALELMNKSFGKLNFEWVHLYHEIAQNYMFLQDSQNNIKYVKLAADIINQYHDSPSPIKTQNVQIGLLGLVEGCGAMTTIFQEYSNNFTSYHRTIIGEESEMTLNVELHYLTKGKYSNLQNARESQFSL